MSGTMFMRVSEVAEELGVSESYAYKLIQKLNKELTSTSGTAGLDVGKKLQEKVC